MIVEKFEAITEIFSRTSKKLDTIKDLVEKGEMRIENRFLKQNNTLNIETIYAKEATISIGTWFKQGNMMKSHIHEGIIEYLICVRGSFGVSLPHGYRLMKTKDCAAIPENCLHSVTALEDDSKMIAVCIPAEEIYKRSMDNGK